MGGLTVVKDDGVHRHLLPLVKGLVGVARGHHVAGMLILRGGLGCWLLAHVDDMLGFFHPGPNNGRIDRLDPAEQLLSKLPGPPPRSALE
ncbi:hypothetical protein [Streptomyces maremycinicus]|uniref:hypothetical protein n=1 Tax=Streptomyces maremycinicus TaxID=1679753 RepID=UPI000B028C56|nr:hypothetical protein [Streptomyces sp. NBRC 110468]